MRKQGQGWCSKAARPSDRFTLDRLSYGPPRTANPHTKLLPRRAPPSCSRPGVLYVCDDRRYRQNERLCVLIVWCLTLAARVIPFVGNARSADPWRSFGSIGPGCAAGRSRVVASAALPGARLFASQALADTGEGDWMLDSRIRWHCPSGADSVRPGPSRSTGPSHSPSPEDASARLAGDARRRSAGLARAHGRHVAIAPSSQASPLERRFSGSLRPTGPSVR